MMQANELKDFVHGFTEKCNALGVRDDRQVAFLLRKAAEAAAPESIKGTEEAAKTDEDYYRGAGKLMTDLGDILQGDQQAGEVNAVNPFTNQGTSENYQRA